MPVTIRVPLPEEMAHRVDIEELLARRKLAPIEEGFVYTANETQQLPFTFYAAINVNNSRLWEVFTALSQLFPDEELSCVYGLYEEEPVTTDYFPKQQVMAQLQKYATELAKDAMLEFGLLLHTKAQLVELFVTESKYIKFWGSDKAAFVQLMLDLGIPQKTKLAFIDEYPKITEPLRRFVPNAQLPQTVVYGLDRAFGVDRSAL
ncbi:hypothetical protein [Filimonas lacunae]|nr:hypothetical protein [Filimonas lacunae]BAV09452.1 hypothetical protein FLA_5501 [Filimonas lacunae]